MSVFEIDSKNEKKGRRVLVVDDEKMVVDMTCEFLKAAGFEAVSANTTVQAMSEMKKSPVDVVLLDIKLSGEDGLMFLGKLKKRYPKVSVVILTAVGYDETMMRAALRKGASGYVSKDTELENMVAAVKRLLK